MLIAPPLFAGIGEDIGFLSLQAEFGSSLPDGSNLKVAQIEYFRDGAWAPEAVEELAGKVITYSPSNPRSFSQHGLEVGRIFYGSLGSIIPSATRIHAFEAWDYFDNSLLTAKGVAPRAAVWDVENHSYISNSGLSNDEGVRRLDFRIDRDGITATVVLANGTGRVPALFAHSYNAIVVGLSTGNHSRGGTTRNTAGRLKPDIVSNADATSHAGPIVGSAAGLLIAKAKTDRDLSSARRPEGIKAMLMAGATKDELPSWSRTAIAPLDPIYGAGQVNVNNSYRILVAGRQLASDSAIRASRGWDVNSARTGSSKRYFFTIGPGQGGTVSAVLAWNSTVVPNNGAWNQGLRVSVDNYDLRLYRATDQLEKTDLLQDSVSANDNVEHVFLKNVGEGTYVLEVTSVSGSKQFALAWTVLGLDAGSSTPQPAVPVPSVIVAQSAGGTAMTDSPVSSSRMSPFTRSRHRRSPAFFRTGSSSFGVGNSAR